MSGHILTQLVQAVIVRPLSSVSALVRFAEEPQMFAVEFNDGCPIHVSPFGLLVHYLRLQDSGFNEKDLEN